MYTIVARITSHGSIANDGAVNEAPDKRGWWWQQDLGRCADVPVYSVRRCFGERDLSRAKAQHALSVGPAHTKARHGVYNCLMIGIDHNGFSIF